MLAKLGCTLRGGRALGAARSTTTRTTQLVNAKVQAALANGSRRSSASARGWRSARPATTWRTTLAQLDGGARRAQGRAGRARSSSPTSRCGRSAPARRRRRRTRRRSAARSAPGSPSGSRRTPPTGVRILYGGSVKANNVAGDHGAARRRRRPGRRRQPRRRRVRADRPVPGAHQEVAGHRWPGPRTSRTATRSLSLRSCAAP